MILIDSNALVVFIVGLIDLKLIGKHNKTSIYDEEDFYDLLAVIGNHEHLIVLPNIWTEVDNLLNKFGGSHKYNYIIKLTETIKSTSEKYIESKVGVESHNMFDLGLTDSLILEVAKDCKLLITSDSNLSDRAIANGIKVYDLVKAKNERLK